MHAQVAAQSKSPHRADGTRTRQLALPPRSSPVTARTLDAVQRAAGNRVAMAALGDRPPVVQRLTDLTPAQQTKAIKYVNTSLADLGSQHTWAAADQLLTTEEHTTLSTLWKQKVGKKSTHGPTLAKAGLALAQEIVRLLVPRDVVAYANNFDSKHTTTPLAANSAVVLGRLRQPKPLWSTVFDTNYFVATLTQEAHGKDDGQYEWEGYAHTVGANLSLARWDNGDYHRQEPGMFFFKVVYTIATGGRDRTITALHLETDNG